MWTVRLCISLVGATDVDREAMNKLGGCLGCGP